MTAIIIKLAPLEVYGEWYRVKQENRELLVRDNLHLYEAMPAIEVDCSGEEAAEEAFDLTNNPHRQIERVERYGRHRSVSVADIISVDGTDYLCNSIGWIELTPV